MGIVLWLISSMLAVKYLRPRINPEIFIVVAVFIVVLLGIASFGIACLYEWFMGRL